MTNSYAPLGNDSSYSFPYPEEITRTTGLSGLTIPIRSVFEVLARDIEDTEPANAAFYRRVASHYPHCDASGAVIERDKRGAILIDVDDWDELSDEQKLVRGNINSTIAVVDRIRFGLEMMDERADNNKVSEVRRALSAILEDIL